jgi:imidazolonepropionase-like amidohydrolase
MIDCGSSLGLTEVGSVEGTNDQSELGDAQPDLRAEVALNPHSELIPVARANGVLTVLAEPSAGSIGGQSALIDLDGWTPDEMCLVDRVGLHVTLPNVPAKRFGADEEESEKSKSSREEKRNKLKQLFLRSKNDERIRIESAQRHRAMPPREPKLAALLPYAKGERPVIFDADTKENIQAAVAFADELGLKAIISGGRDAWRVADLLREKNVPVLIGPVLTTPRSRTDPYDAPFFNAARLFEKGVAFGFRTGDASNARNLPYHAAMAAAYGLPREQALRALTADAAKILGAGDRLGTLERGKLANVIVTDGDPLEIRTSLHYAFVAGRPVSLETKHTRLYEKFLQRLEPRPGETQKPIETSSTATPASAGGK